MTLLRRSCYIFRRVDDVSSFNDDNVNLIHKAEDGDNNNNDDMKDIDTNKQNQKRRNP